MKNQSYQKDFFSRFDRNPHQKFYMKSFLIKSDLNLNILTMATLIIQWKVVTLTCKNIPLA